MRIIPILNSSEVAWVDDADYENVIRWVWRLVGGRPTRYVPTGEHGRKGRSVGQYLHVFLLGKRAGFEIDHKDRYPLNCQRDNLRWATRTQNLANQRKLRGSSSYKGVSFMADRRRWRAAIQVNRRKTVLGEFMQEDSAARAYDVAARQLFGEFAWLNFPENKT